jgi:uncharacterized protein (TIGR03435 family)
MAYVTIPQVARCVLSACVLAFLPRSPAQSQNGISPSFEVASIRPHNTPVTTVGISVSGSRVTVVAYGLLGLLMDAYKLEPYQIIGGPKWMDSDRFDIAAKAEGDGAPAPAQVGQMLQSLLADRFHLQVHRGTRELPLYVLVVGRAGSKMRASDTDAAPSFSMRSSGGLTDIRVSKGTMEQLAKQLSSAGAGRPVLDRSGLRGSYDFELRWSPDLSAAPNVSEASRTPSLFTAIQEQLGLRLEATKGPVQVLVIDHVEKPSEN